MRPPDDERFTDLDRPPRGRRPPRRWSGTAGQRARASRRLPQAVFKITSYSRSGGAVHGRFAYITRAGEAEAEGPNGERLDQAALAARAGEWSEEAEARHTRQYAMSAILSFPADVDEEKATEAARQFLRAAFADNHDYVFAGHRDTKNFHIHFVVQSAGLDGKQLRIRRDDLQDLRLRFAEKAAEQGIELDASPRWARGEEQARPPGPKIEGMMRRWGNPERALDGAWFLSSSRRTQLEALVDVRRDRDPEAAHVTPLEYARAAEHLVEQAGAAANNKEQVQTLKAAIQLARFGMQQSADPNCPAAEAAAVEQVAAQVDNALTAQISELSEDRAAQRAALQARWPLADQLAAGRPDPERRWAREEEAARPTPAVGVQALEYARAAGRVALQIPTLPHDQDRVAAVKGAVSLARFGWELAERAPAPTPAQEQARLVIDKTERALREVIEQIEDPEAKREAIQARAGLYQAGVKEYRAERREAERQRSRERDDFDLER